MLLSFNQSDSFKDIIDKCQHSLQLWETLLNITGGAVELKKCFIIVLQYKEDYKWHNPAPGVPQVQQPDQNRHQCIITREGTKGTIIRQQNVTEGVCLLGIKAAADGTYKQEYMTRLDKSRELAGRLKAVPLNLSLTWQAYYCRWKPAITYCLPITTFSLKECGKIQSPFFTALLPKLGINRHIPRALLHGPLVVKSEEDSNLHTIQNNIRMAHGMTIQKFLTLSWSNSQRGVFTDLYFTSVSSVEEMMRIGLLRFIDVVNIATKNFL